MTTLEKLRQEYEDLMRQGRGEEAQRVLAARDAVLMTSLQRIAYHEPQRDETAENMRQTPGDRRRMT